MNKVLVDLPERIETPRFMLQMPKAGFGQKLHNAVLDGYEDYVKWLNWPTGVPIPQTLEEECRRHHADFILRDFIRYLIIEKETGDVVGRCAFPPFQAHWAIPQFGISYFVRKMRRNRGYATEAVHAMTLLAFEALNAKKVEIYCDAENTPSTRVPLKLGFKLEYTQKGGWPRSDGKLAELQTYALFSKEELLPPGPTL
ncbi:MAG: GNAT family N-acetyltransferase [Proteobacteria bacterium]|nr:GNAT family N-acetyltransferase [Pseudomonadota bacterium]